MTAAYITGVGSFLPNAPVINDDIEAILGLVDGVTSRTRRIILRNNGIKTRHYAIDRETGRMTHDNAGLTVEALLALGKNVSTPWSSVGVLAAGTSSPDVLIPGHAAMVHGRLGRTGVGIGPVEVESPSGVCITGLSAVKYAAAAILQGETRAALAAGSELASNHLRASAFEAEIEARRNPDLEQHPELGFEADFLRWMLSDGAGAVLVENAPRAEGLGLRIDWIDIRSYAHINPVCMYAGGSRTPEGEMTGWRDIPHGERAAKGVFNLRQDAKLLNERIVDVIVNKTLGGIVKQRQLRPGDIDYYLPHISSEYFRNPVAKAMESIDFPIAQEQWITTLTRTGNIGAASMYLMLEEALYHRDLKPGQRLLCMVPESSRFLCGYMHLTVVGPKGSTRAD